MTGPSASSIAADNEGAATAAAVADVAPSVGLTSTVRRGLTGIVLARLAVNGGVRVDYPFLAVLATGLGVPLHAIAALVAARSLAGLAGPLIARAIPPQRRRTFMVASPLTVVAGCMLIAGSWAAPAALRIGVVAVGFVATGVARPLFDLPMQTWVSERVPAVSRGRALGIAGLSWPLSLAATVPPAGVLIANFGWRSLFVLVAVMAAAGALSLALLLPRGAANVLTDSAHERPPSHAQRAARRIPTGVAVCTGVGLVVAAKEVLLVVYGSWLTHAFGLSIAQVGASTMLIVVAELLGGGLVVAVADRIGLCHTLFAALSISVVTYAALGLIGGSVALGGAAVAMVFIAFETTFIVLVALASTAARHAYRRARLLGAFMAAVAVGNACGALLAAPVFAHGGIALSGAVSAGIAATAAAVLWRGSRPNPDLPA